MEHRTINKNLHFPISFVVVSLLYVICYMFYAAPSALAAARYPISDLGNCRNQQECKLYCQIPQNTPTCWSYGRFELNKDVLGEETSKITFPVSELGNCGSALECRAYCTKTENHEACREFAVKNGLAKPSAITQKIIDAAKAELSCSTIAECQTACERPENKDICESFAKKHNLVEKAAPIAREIITQAKEALGCTDAESCRAVCEKPENQQICLEFGEKHKLLKKEVIERVKASIQSKGSARFLSAKPGAPCANDKSCMEYCKEHPTECPGFEMAQRALSNLQPTGSGSPPANAKFKIGDFLGPTGCLTEGECKAFCEKFPDKCPSFPKKPTSFPTIKLSVPPDRSGGNKGSGSLNSGKGSFSKLLDDDKPDDEIEDENETEPTEAPIN